MPGRLFLVPRCYSALGDVGRGWVACASGGVWCRGHLLKFVLGLSLPSVVGSSRHSGKLSSFGTWLPPSTRWLHLSALPRAWTSSLFGRVPVLSICSGWSHFHFLVSAGLRCLRRALAFRVFAGLTLVVSPPCSSRLPLGAPLFALKLPFGCLGCLSYLSLLPAASLFLCQLSIQSAPLFA